MTTHVSGQPVATAAAPTLYLSALRRNILAVIVGNALFSDAEQLRANHNAHECACPKKLALWLKNTRRVAAERDHAAGCALLAAGIVQFEAKLAGAVAPANAPTAAQATELAQLIAHPALLACAKSQARQALPDLTKAGATRLIGRLWGKVLNRTGQGAGSDFSTSYAA